MDVIFTALALVFSAAAVGLGSAALALALGAKRAPGEGAPPADGGGEEGAAVDGAPADAAAEREQRRLQEGIANILGYGMEELLGRRGERG